MVKPILVHLDEELYNKIKISAKKEQRSVVGYIRYYLSKILEEK